MIFFFCKMWLFIVLIFCCILVYHNSFVLCLHVYPVCVFCVRFISCLLCSWCLCKPCKKHWKYEITSIRYLLGMLVCWPTKTTKTNQQYNYDIVQKKMNYICVMSKTWFKNACLISNRYSTNITITYKNIVSFVLKNTRFALKNQINLH